MTRTWFAVLLLGLAACGEVNTSPVVSDPPDAGIDADDTNPEAPDASIDASADGGDATMPKPQSPHNLVFVTSQAFTGAIGGRDRADAICNELAHAAGHQGTFRAYLSTRLENARSRLGTARGWVRTDGVPFADTIDDLAGNKPLSAIGVDETGAPVSTPFNVWTATRSGNSFVNASYNTCDDWTSTTPTIGTARAWVGHAKRAGELFQFSEAPSCTTMARIACFQIDKQAPLTPPATPDYKLAFVTPAQPDTELWSPTTRFAGADAVCQRHATAHGRTGRFRAVLATATTAAKSRFLPTDGPWKRVDGMPLTRPDVSLFDDTQDWLAPLNLDLAGVHYGAAQVWLGAATLSEPGTAGRTCGDWSDAGSDANPIHTLGRHAAEVGKTTFPAPCRTARQLLCLEVDG